MAPPLGRLGSAALPLRMGMRICPSFFSSSVSASSTGMTTRPASSFNRQAPQVPEREALS
jgi:hypothetical protein